MKKIVTILVTLALVISLSGCLSARLLRQAENLWKKNQPADALLSVCASLLEDPNFEKSKTFMAQRYELGIQLIEKQIESYKTLNEPIRSEKIVDVYEKLVRLNTQMNSFVYPFTDKKATYSWTPVEIRDYTEPYAFAKKEAVNAFLTAAESATSWEEIDTLGKKAMKNASTAIEQNRINETIPAIFYNKALSHYALKNEKNYLIALKGMEYCSAWNAGFRDVETQKQKIKTSLADLYYNNALSLSGARASRAQLKEALVELDKANRWIPNYRNASNMKMEVEERLTLYLYPVFPSSNYNYGNNLNFFDSELPNDIRGLFLSQLKGALGNKSYYRFSKRGLGGNLDSVFHKLILDLHGSSYGEPPFISAATRSGVNFIVKMEISAGEKAGRIETKTKEDQKSRAIQKPVIQVIYTNSEGATVKLISRPPVEKIDQLENFRPELIHEILIKYGAAIPEGAQYQWTKSSETQYVQWIEKTEIIVYPIRFQWELIDVPTRKVVLKGSDSTSKKQVSCVYTSAVIKNREYYNPSIDGTTARQPHYPTETEMVTKEVLDGFFKKTVQTITPYLKSIE